jgi:anthranilate synthase component 1
MQFFPSRADFHLLAISHTVVPVWTEVLADMETPVAAYLKLVGDDPGFLLESVENGERWSRYSFVGRNPLATLVLRDGQITRLATSRVARCSIRAYWRQWSPYSRSIRLP